MKLALITDQHFGVRGDSLIFHDFFEKFYAEYFFPFLKENGISTVIDLGDTFDRRKYVNFNTLHRAKRYWYDKLVEYDCSLYSLVGNHVIPYKNTLKINALDLLLGEYHDRVENISVPKTITFDDTSILMLPWICDENYKQSMELINSTKAQICFGHLELGGFEMHKGTVMHDGADANIFSKFDLVCSGHYHHRSSRGNIHYLGCPYEMTWSDYNDPKGFHIFDTDTRTLTFIENPYTMFHKIVYDDSNTTLNDLLETDFSKYKGTYVKIIVRSKTNPYWYDLFVDGLEKADPVNVQAVDDNLNLNLESDGEIIDEAESTIDILKKYVEGLDMVDDKLKPALDNLLRSLYEEALQIGSV